MSGVITAMNLLSVVVHVWHGRRMAKPALPQAVLPRSRLVGHPGRSHRQVRGADPRDVATLL